MTWSSRAYQGRVVAAIESLSLPWFDDSDVGSQDWEVAVQDVQSYIEKLQTGATAGELARRLVCWTVRAIKNVLFFAKVF